MFRSVLRSAPVALTALSALALTGAPAAHATLRGADTYVCRGGDIPAGQYYELVVRGDCTIPKGRVTVETQLYVTPHAVLNAVTAATVHVRGNVQVGRGAVLGLGCSPHAGCTTTTHDEVNGNIDSDHALAVILHSDKVKGNITTLGDGGGVNCDTLPSLAPFGGVAFDDFEDNTVGGYLTSSGLRSCWMGISRNLVGTNILVSDDRTFLTQGPSAGNAVGSNTVRGDLGCYGNDPAPHFGSSTGPNRVNGLKLGQCAAL